MVNVSALLRERFSTTAASATDLSLGEEGQSLIEFLLILPFLVGLVLLTVKIGTAIQISMVNQKYARAQATYLAYNSPVYPARINFGNSGAGLAITDLESKGYNRMVMGVSAESVKPEEGETRSPKAMTQLIARSTSKSEGPDPNQQEPDRRSLVRIRTTVTLCTPSHVVAAGNTFASYALSQERFGPDFTAGTLAYCRSPFQ